MTTEELRSTFNDKFELNKWPQAYEVDHETYANVCQYTFHKKNDGEPIIFIAIGKHGGILFKGVELLLKT
jgi:hypothetical protein